MKINKEKFKTIVIGETCKKIAEINRSKMRVDKNRFLEIK